LGLEEQQLLCGRPERFREQRAQLGKERLRILKGRGRLGQR
jgi:hypothetical protein